MRKALAWTAVIAVAAISPWFLRRPAVAPEPRRVTVSIDGETSPSAPLTTAIPLADAQPVLDAFRGHLPAELTGKSAAELAAAWPAWAARHDAAIRARLAEGDEDSVVNLWLYGTTFTTLPRATEQELAAGPGARAEELLLKRLDDLISGLASPGANERLQFARQVVERQGIIPTTEQGQQEARVYLVKTRERAIAAYARYRRAAQAAGTAGTRESALSAYSTMYRDRGLSSDTRIAADFALDKALEAIAAKGRIAAGRVAIVGPGLDFTDKAEGYDFYPPQTIQPFALVDSLARYHLHRADEVRVTTLDLSPRVNGHLRGARARAARGEPYVVQLPLPNDDPAHQWHPDLVAYWQRFGDRIGAEAPAYPAPAVAGPVRVRAVSVRPAVTLSIAPQDVNIVVQRLELPEADRFDLIVATNILVYYDGFEQALALANIAKMLRPGGYFVTNYKVSPLPPLEPSASVVTPVFFDRQGNGDTLFCYRRQ